MDDHVDVAFGRFATSDGALNARLDPDTKSCSAVYCHGAFPGGNAGNAPVWTSAGQGQGECGTCHGLPPALAHPGVPADRSRCVQCHAPSVDAAGDLVAGGKHLDGRVDAGHADPWMVATSGAFHGTSAGQGLSTCLPCHGADLAGGTAGVACADCHGSAGQLTCTSCHRRVPGDAENRSSHLAGAGTSSGDCRTCHDASQEANGHYRLPGRGGEFPDDSCRSCHDGQGVALSGRTPPLLVGWTDTVAGDWHGARTGTGHGGTLAAPYARRQAPLPCTACHAHHASANAFLFRATVNGRPVPAGAIDRAGVGAEALCTACHEGERHAGCLACHAVDPEPPGKPCFWCHGHEGISNWTPPTGCDACHYINMPPVERIPPALSPWSSPSVSGITATSATFRWSTTETATSYVEYGIAIAGSVSGDGARVGSHAVTLTGLEPATTYVWRVRSSDEFRNVLVGPLSTFRTPAADEVPWPDLAPVSAGTQTPNTTAVATLLWYPVTAPSATAVEYEVQLASDPGFTFLEKASLGRTDTTLTTGNSGWIAGTATTDGSWPRRPALGFDALLTDLPQDQCAGPPDVNAYWFRVRARDATGKVSAWSDAGSFTAGAIDPYCE
jgi:predicted CxxxxCH...CXXCH cytochrome family protein